MMKHLLIDIILTVLLILISLSYGCWGHNYDKFIPELPEKLKPYAVPTLIKASLNSFSGFLNGINSAQMYFWHFPSESKTSDPLILWLQGDIGTSSVKGIFENNGPFYVKTKGLNSRKHYWSKNFNMLYMDTTTGAGYSYANSGWVLPQNIDELTSNLLTALQSFLQIFDHLRDNDVYLSGDGFACPIITNMGEKINETRLPIKLKGLILENGFCDPMKAVTVTNHYLNLRIIDSGRFNAMVQAEREVIKLLQDKKFDSAFNKYDEYIKGILTPYKTLFNNYTLYKSTRNLLYDVEYRMYGNYTAYMMKDMIKLYLNIPKQLAFNDGRQALKTLKGELMKSSTAELSKLINKYNVLMYYGQTNPEITPNAAYNIASSLKWCGGEYFGDVNYEPWFVNNKLAGYVVDVRTGDCEGSLSWALVRNAGKDVADEKSEEVLDLLNKFVQDSLP